MRNLYTWVACLMVFTGVCAAQSKVNPVTQINWPLITGAGTPGSLFIACSAANYGQPFQNTAVTPNTYYTCGTDGWAIRGGSGGGAAFPGTNGVVFNTSTTAARNAVYTDIVPLFGSGSCVGFLNGDGTCGVPTATGTAGGALVGTYPNPLIANLGTSGSADNGFIVFNNGDGTVSQARATRFGDDVSTLSWDSNDAYVFHNGFQNAITLYDVYNNFGGSCAGSQFRVISNDLEKASAWFGVNSLLYDGTACTDTQGNSVGAPDNVAKFGPGGAYLAATDEGTIWVGGLENNDSGTANFGGDVGDPPVLTYGGVGHLSYRWTAPYLKSLGGGLWYTDATTGQLENATSPQIVTAMNVSPSSTLDPALLPTATTSVLGAVKPDGTTITISGGVISSVGGGGGTTFQVNGTPLTTATTVNYQDGTGNGGVNFTNPSGGVVEANLSKPINGAGTGLVSGPASPTSGDVAFFTGGAGAITDGLVAGANLVTSTSTLTPSQILLGGGTKATAALGSLGTTTTVLHGNASGAPTFGAVSLTADVAGVLPVANGGTGSFNSLSHSVVIGATTGAYGTSNVGALGTVLMAQGASADPTFLQLAGDVSLNGTTGAVTVSKSTNLRGGLLGSVPYQSAVDTTSLLAGNATNGLYALTENVTASAAVAPAWTALGTAAAAATGTSGATLCFLSTACTFSAAITIMQTTNAAGSGLFISNNLNTRSMNLYCDTSNCDVNSQSGTRGLAFISNGVTSNASFTAPQYLTTTNCSSSASPAVCGSASAGSFVIAAAGTTVTVNTTAVTANSQIEIQPDESLGTKLSVTCNTLISAVISPVITARVAGTSFTVTIPGTGLVTNPACYSYTITN